MQTEDQLPSLNRVSAQHRPAGGFLQPAEVWELLENLRELSRQSASGHADHPPFEEHLVRRSRLSLLPLMACYAVSLWAGLGISASFPETVYQATLDTENLALVLSVPLALLPGALLLLRILQQLDDRRLSLAETHLCLTKGICTGRRHHTEIPYENILFVEVQQSLLDRGLNVGTILVGRNAQERAELVMPGVRKPHDYTSRIKERIQIRRRSPSARAPVH